MNGPITLANIRAFTTDTTAPDDFLNLYPEDVPDNMGGLVETGFGFSPFLFSAILVVSIGAVILGRRRRRA